MRCCNNHTQRERFLRIESEIQYDKKVAATFFLNHTVGFYSRKKDTYVAMEIKHGPTCVFFP